MMSNLNRYGGSTLDQSDPTSRRNDGHSLRPSTYLLTASEIGKLFQVSGRTVRRWSQNNLIPSIKVGRTRRFDIEIIRSFIASEVRSNLEQIVEELER